MLKMRNASVLALLLASACYLHSQGPLRQASKQVQLTRPNGATFARDRSGEDAIAKSLTGILTQNGITGLSRYNPTLLSEGVCSSVLKGEWVSMMLTDEGPSAFYETDDINHPGDHLRNLATYITAHYEVKRHATPFKRFAVAVWKEDMPSGATRYWVGVLLAKSPISDWLGLHLGGDTPKEMRSPNYEAEEDVAPACRSK